MERIIARWHLWSIPMRKTQYNKIKSLGGGGALLHSAIRKVLRILQCSDQSVFSVLLWSPAQFHCSPYTMHTYCISSICCFIIQWGREKLCFLKLISWLLRRVLFLFGKITWWLLNEWPVPSCLGALREWVRVKQILKVKTSYLIKWETLLLFWNNLRMIGWKHW